MTLQDKIKEIRLRLNYNQEEFGKKLGCTGVYISQIESGKRPVSPKFFHKLTNILNLTKKEIEDLKNLLIEEHLKKEKESYEEKILKSSRRESKEEHASYLETLPEHFLKRLKRDLAYKDKNKILKAISMTSDELDGVLRGELLLTRKKIIEMAKALNQPIEQYLSLSNSIPEHLKKIFEFSGLLPMFRAGEMTPEEIDTMIDFIDGFLTDINMAKNVVGLMSTLKKRTR